MEKEEVELIHLLKKGAPHAYKQLFDMYYVILCKVAYEFLRDQFLAEAIANDVITTLWETRQKLDIKISVKSYLIGAATIVPYKPFLA